MLYNHYSLATQSVLLWSDIAALELSCPLEGIIRARFAPNARSSSAVFPRLPSKNSFAVLPSDLLPIDSLLEDGILSLEAGGVHFELELHSGEWKFFDAASELLCRGFAASGGTTHQFPLDTHSARLELRAPKGEAYLGFGEKVGTLDKRGMHLTFWNTDVVPHLPDTDPLYQSIPFFIGLKNGVAWGFFLDETWRSEVDVARAHPERLVWSSLGQEMDCYLIAGDTIQNVLLRYTALTGRQPLAPLWALGAQQSRWGYENENDVRQIIKAYKQHNLPLDVISTDIDYQDGFKVWTWDKSRYPDPQKLCAEAAAEGVKIVPIVDPGVKLETGYSVYEEAQKNDYLVRFERGDTLVGEVWPKPAVFPDFTRAEVRNWWADQHRTMLELGIAGFWNDMNEPSSFSLQRASNFSDDGSLKEGTGKVEGKTLPYDARHGTRRHVEVHNVYGLTMCAATRAALERFGNGKRGFVLTRAGFAGIQRYSAVWTGDNSSYWEHLALSIPMLLGLGLSGVAFTGADIPGFAAHASGELLARWYQLGAFYPLMRNHSAKGTSPQEPWRFGEPYLSIARRALEMRYALLPTLYTLMYSASQTGLPVLRPMLLLEPNNKNALEANHQLMFGDALLVAPIVSANTTKRLTYLPAGRWLEMPNLEPRRIVHGEYIVSDAPLEQIPLYLRAGFALASETRTQQHTSTANWQNLKWQILAAPKIQGELYEDAGDGYGANRYSRLQGHWDEQVLRLEKTSTGSLAFERQLEQVVIYGLAKVHEVHSDGLLANADAEPFDFHEHPDCSTLTVMLQPDWTWLELRSEAKSVML
ncbi:MAG: glycoside hydrolase family 31 protein [Deinococcales bacterium]